MWPESPVSHTTWRTVDGITVDMPKERMTKNNAKRSVEISSLFDIDVNYLDVLIRFIRLVRLHILNRMHRLQPRKKASKYGVLIVEPWRGIGGDEEL